jgi:hypothetical protein
MIAISEEKVGLFMRSCHRCGRPLYEGFAFCQNCGAPASLGSLPVRRRAASTPLVLSATAFILAVVLVLGLWRPGFLWTLKESMNWPPSLGGNATGEDADLEELLAEKPVYNPSEIPVSGTPAFKVSPVDGITVSAEKNALDQERVFTAEPLSESEMGKLFFDLSAGEWAPVFAFEFDAGLEDDERLPGKVKVEMELNKFGVKKELWPYLTVLRISGDGSVMELPTTVTGKGLSCETRQNSILAVTIGLAIGIPVMAYIERGQDGLDKLYPNEVFYEAVYPGLKNAKAQYRVTYPKSMARMDSPELKALDDRIRALIERYSLDPDLPLLEAARKACEALGANPEYQDVKIEDAAYRLMQKVVNDPEYLSVQNTFNDPQWQQRNLWPESVANTCNRLARADTYLFGERDFRIPTHVIEVVVLDRWPHGADTLGVSKNLYTSSPYIHINALKTSDMQDLLLTVTHELFHVVQSGYDIYDSSDYTSFWEAAAVLLEKEAFQYYVADRLIDSGRTDLLTDRDKWELFDKPLMTPSEWNDVADINQYMQNQGYVSSHWIEFLKNRYHPGDEFLKQLMERFSSTIGNLDTSVHIALRDQTSSDETAYCSDFRLFCIQNYSSIGFRSSYIEPKPAAIELSADEPYVKIEMPYQPFSTRVRDIRIDSADDKGEKQTYKILAKGSAPGLVTPTVRFYQDDKFKTFLTGDNMAMLPNSTSSILNAHEIEDYFMTTPGATAGTGYEYELWLMLPPEAPDVEIDGEEGVMRVIPGEFSLSGDISAGYDVVVITPEKEQFSFPQDAGEDEAEIPLKELKSEKKSDDTEEPKYTVYLVERVEFPDGSMQYGPDGEKFEMDDELRFEDILGTYDMTQTVSEFDSSYLDEAVGQAEGVPGMEDYMEQYSQVMGGMKGTYTGSMVIEKYQTGGQIAEVTFTASGSESANTSYRGTWDKGVLHLEPIDVVLGGNWDLTFMKEKGKVTCEGSSDYKSDMVSYSFSVTAIKRN